MHVRFLGQEYPPAVHICWPPWDEAITQEAGQGRKHPGQNDRRRFQGVASAAGRQAWVPAGLPPAWCWELHSHSTPHPVSPAPPGWEARVLEHSSGQLLPGGRILQAPAGPWVSTPLRGNLVPSGSAGLASPNCAAHADTVFSEHRVLRQLCLQGP